jgi:hypothetical protein
MRQHGRAADRGGQFATGRTGLWKTNARNSPIPVAAPASNGGTTDAFLAPLSAVSPGGPDLRARFEALAQRWREETELHSAAGALFMHPAYQEMIGLGPAVLPLMLADLEKTHDHWFWALRAITGENPVPAEERGKVDRMAERWVDWGRARGLL